MIERCEGTIDETENKKLTTCVSEVYESLIPLPNSDKVKVLLSVTYLLGIDPKKIFNT